MLEQAVVDAQSLKEAAIKNAEHEVLEKYSQEIKEAVDTLLEQEGEEEFMGDEFMGDDTTIEVDDIVDDIPPAYAEGEDACPCPDEDEVVVLDLDQIKAEVEEAEGLPDQEMELPGMDGGMMYETTEEELENLLVETSRGQEEIQEEELDEELDEEIELDEESLKAAIAEILKVDLEVVPRGDLGTTHPTKMQQEYAVDVALAAVQSTEAVEGNKKLKKALEQLAEQVNSLRLEKNELLKTNKELKSIALEVSQKIEEVNTSNAKLIYTNHILKSNSLNERQKTKLVEAISKTNSIKEAKVVYETLKESISAKLEKSPKSLNEAVSRNNQLILKSNKETKQVTDSQAERMKRLAGII